MSDDPPPVPVRAVVLDVDGVIFRGHFFVGLSRRVGMHAMCAALRDAFLFNVGKLTLTELLVRSYGRLRGLPRAVVDEVFRTMPRAHHVRETVAQLKQRGMTVLVLSSGVPDRLVKELACELGADEGAGIDTLEEGDRLTGAVGGALAHDEGKVRFVEAWCGSHGLSWNALAVVGDDDNNLGLMERAGRSIGMRATLGVRRKAAALIEGDDMREVLPLLADAGPPRPRPCLRTELQRRGIHAMAFAWPFLARWSFAGAIALLLAAMLVYGASEYFRLNGLRVPLVSAVTRRTLRPREARRFAAAPISLGIGVIACLYFPHPIPSIAIGIVALGDSVAGLVGQFLGRVPLFHNPMKTVEGTGASFLVSLALCAYFMPLPEAALTACFAALLESLPLGDLDNVVVPVATAAVCMALM